MTLVPDLTPRDDERLLLYSARYAVTIFANMYVFAVAFALLQGSGNSAAAERDPGTYLNLTMAVLSVGVAFSILFLFLGRTDALEVVAPAAGSKSSSSSKGGKGSSEEDKLAAPGALSVQVSSAPEAAVAAPAAARPGKTNTEWLMTLVFWKTLAVYVFMRLAVTIAGVYM